MRQRFVCLVDYDTLCFRESHPETNGVTYSINPFLSYFLKQLDEINFQTKGKVETFEIPLVVLINDDVVRLEKNKIYSSKDVMEDSQYNDLFRLCFKLTSFLARYRFENGGYHLPYSAFKEILFVSSNCELSVITKLLRVKSLEKVFCLSSNASLFQLAQSNDDCVLKEVVKTENDMAIKKRHQVFIDLLFARVQNWLLQTAPELMRSKNDAQQDLDVSDHKSLSEQKSSHVFFVEKIEADDSDDSIDDCSGVPIEEAVQAATSPLPQESAMASQRLFGQVSSLFSQAAGQVSQSGFFRKMF